MDLEEHSSEDDEPLLLDVGSVCRPKSTSRRSVKQLYSYPVIEHFSRRDFEKQHLFFNQFSITDITDISLSSYITVLKYPILYFSYKNQ